MYMDWKGNCMSEISRSLTKQIDTYFSNLLEREDITEICYNGGNKLFALSANGGWEKHDTNFSEKSAKTLATAVSSEKEIDIRAAKPILSGILNNMERIQIVLAPATHKHVISITIRKPSNFKISMQEYENQKLFEVTKDKERKKDDLLEMYQKKEYRQFIENAVIQGKTIVVAGATGSGKTTFMKTLIDYIPHEERIISIEDVEELVFNQHENYVQLFYPSEAKAGDFLTAAALLKSCLRMKPDRIIIAELRGGETFDFINVVNSGHSGSITSCHAGSVSETFSRLALMTLQNESGQKIPFPVIKQTLREAIDIVIHMAYTKTGRRITEVYYKEAHEAENIKEKEEI